MPSVYLAQRWGDSVTLDEHGHKLCRLQLEPVALMPRPRMSQQFLILIELPVQARLLQ